MSLISDLQHKFITTLRSALVIAIPSVVCLFVVCDLGALYSEGWTVLQWYCGLTGSVVKKTA